MTRKVTEHLFKKQDKAHKARKHILNEWEHIQHNIRELSRALESETNEVLNRDIETDIVVLISRRNQLSDRLHIN